MVVLLKNSYIIDLVIQWQNAGVETFFSSPTSAECKVEY